MKTQKLIDELWIIEAEKRFKDIQDSKAKLIPGEQALHNLRKRLRY